MQWNHSRTRAEINLKPVKTTRKPIQAVTIINHQNPRKGGGGVIPPPVKTTPFDKRTLKNAPPRSDSAQKRAPKQRIPTQLHRGKGGNVSEPEKTSPRRKEPENTPDATPPTPKGAPTHTQKPPRHHTPRKNPTPTNDDDETPLPPPKPRQTQTTMVGPEGFEPTTPRL